MFGIERLVNGYPSHGFVIDSREASDLFYNAESMTGGEYDIVIGVGIDASWPNDKPQIRDLVAEAKERLTSGDDPAYTVQRDNDSLAGQQQPEDGDAPETTEQDGSADEGANGAGDSAGGTGKTEGASEATGPPEEDDSKGPSDAESGVDSGQVERAS